MTIVDHDYVDICAWVRSLTAEERGLILDSFTTEQLRQTIACREVREQITGESLADEVARLTAWADYETEIAFEASWAVAPPPVEAEDRSPMEVVENIAYEMMAGGIYPAEIVAQAVVTGFDGWRGLTYEETVSAVAAGIGRMDGGMSRAA